MGGGAHGVEADRPQPVVDEGAYVSRLQLVFPHYRPAGVGKIFHRPFEGHAVDPGRAVESLYVFGQAEDRRPVAGLVRPDSLEHPGSVMKGVAEYMHGGLVPGDQLTVHPDIH